MVSVLPASVFRLEDALARVERVLARSVECDEPLLERMARSVVFAGGKRMRPRLTLLAYGACGGPGPRPEQDGKRGAHDLVVDACAAVELIHTASLVHDDIMDASPLRRGAPTLHTSHGLGHAIVAADFLFSRGFALAGRQEEAVIRIVEEACARLAEGQVLEQRLAGNPQVDVPAYLKVIERKTAAPLRACALVGARLAGASWEVAEALGEYGLDTGLAFQMADDLLDLTGDPSETGKPVGLDGAAGVLTLPALLALGPEERAKLLRDPEALRRTLVEHGAIEKAREFALRYSERARRRLDVLPPSPHRDELARLARVVVDRRA